MQTEIRWLILNFPEKVTCEPSALEIMFDSSLQADVNFQLKVSIQNALDYVVLPTTDCKIVSFVLGSCQPK
jgi:hypothetical protein